MSIRVNILSEQLVQVTGLDGKRKAESRASLVRAARVVQFRVAELFEGSRLGSGPLLANQDSYTVRKIKAGLDPRRGHKEGTLQAALYSLTLFIVSAIDDAGSATVLFYDDPLVTALDYAEHFIEAKSRTGLLVVVNQSMADEMQNYLRGEAAAAKIRRTPLRPAKLPRPTTPKRRVEQEQRELGSVVRIAG